MEDTIPRQLTLKYFQSKITPTRYKRYFVYTKYLLVYVWQPCLTITSNNVHNNFYWSFEKKCATYFEKRT